MSDQKKENRGGARKGAGRKATRGEPLQSVTLQLAPEHIRLAEQFGAGNLSAGVRILLDMGITAAAQIAASMPRE